jgi:hypothetical protein
MTISLYPPIAGTTSSVSNAPWYMQVSRGQVSGCSVVNIFGYNAAVTTTACLIWELANVPTQYVYPTAAVQLSIVSSSASDTSAKSVLISGLDSGYNQISETKTLNGTSAVTTVNSYLRVNSIIMTNASNTGDITVTSSSPSAGNVVAKINAGVGRNQAALYSVPIGYTFYGTRYTGFGSEAGGATSYAVWLAKTSNAVTGQSYTIAQSPYANTYLIQRVAPFVHAAQTDIQWQGYTGSGTHPLAVNVEGILISNTAF